MRFNTLTFTFIEAVAASGATAAPSHTNAPSIASVERHRANLTVDITLTHQNIDGFGFCEAFQRAHSIRNLPEPYQKQVLDLLFDQKTGAGLSILRLGLGSSENSTLDHMNSPQPTEDGPFAWDRQDSGQVWVAKQVQKYGVTTFYADAWSAPGYMKTNGRDDQGGWLCGVRGEGQSNGTSCGDGSSFVIAYAQYLARYVQGWFEEGIPIQHVGFLNEPNLIKPYATMQSNGYQAADEIFALSIALGGIGLPSVGISCCEAQGWSMARDILAEVQAASAEDQLSVITTHTYKGTPPGPERPLNTTLPVWVTEISPIMDRLGMTQTWYRNNSENEGLRNGVNIHEALVTGNVSAYIYWIGVSQSSAEAPFIWAPNRDRNDTRETMWWPNEQVNMTTGIKTNSSVPYYTIGSTYWATAHYSRFIRPGAKRVGTELKSSGGVSKSILSSAYVNQDRSVVVQIINNGDAEVDVDVLVLRSGPVSSAKSKTCRVDTWITDNSRRFVSVGLGEAVSEDGTFEKSLPARSLTTFVVRC
ncbi:glycoside hydrolase family 30 protein [Apodospora peruviana]|uniref:Glycoside hydrolase family 30 protein n=1 Tax=Apodospora peruviana TaxID=516989 RepID=A0AAE0M171_9PEZI|nr:glycoside hydrolase family 30 protein [Apodospora peruviana]